IEKLYYKNLVNLNSGRLKVVNQKNILNEKFNLFFESKKNEVKNALNKLDAFNPAKILSSGYAKVFLNGDTVKSVRQVKAGDNLNIRLIDGKVTAKVSEVKNDV
ncbi:MAG: hypothetical protein FWG51_01555, partial [Firmicutes bacterium]|nr:hypothetical protein [Bacillota bacterium]